MKKFKKALNASKHIQGGEILYTTTGSSHKFPFPRNKSVNNIIDSIVDELNETPIIHNNFSIKSFLRKI